jgi:beta-lactamase class A
LVGIERRLRELFTAAGARGYVHVADVDAEASIEVDAEVGVCAASVIKVIVAVAYARAVCAGDLDPSEIVTVPARYQIGGAGTAGCAGPVSMSLGDLALFMMTMSDNAATDVIYQRVGQSALDAVVTDLHLHDTYVRGDMEWIALNTAAELGLPGTLDLDSHFRRAGERVWQLSLLDPARTNASTAQDIGTLLRTVWTDRAASPRACSLVRTLMSQAITTHGLAAGFPDDVEVAAKTGTLPAVRNEAGVVSYPDGSRYTVAIFTRATALTERQPAINAAISTAARIAVDHLRLRR